MKENNILKIIITSIIIILLLLVVLSSYSFSIYGIRENINVGLMINIKSFKVCSSNDLFITSKNNEKITFPKNTLIDVNYINNGYVSMGNYNLTLPVKIETTCNNNLIYISNKPYHGILIVKENSSCNGINVINILSIEEYLKGVIPKEASCNWPIEALKVQAIISRTYAIANFNKHSEFDLCSTTHCQVYDGALQECRSCNMAIYSTLNEVLTYNDSVLVETLFHSTCGGHTESPISIWNSKNPPIYLQGVECGYCSSTKYAKWDTILQESFIRQKLSEYENNIGKIKKIKVIEKTKFGAAKNIRITHSNGKFTINAYKFRILVDAHKIKSNFFYVIDKMDETNFYFSGEGWGHRVGLCQNGSMVMAQKGYNYKDILLHFYPGTKIRKISYF
ncbi:MAG: SpoIID/LytB domain-containing protein [Endomicrobium sp.]|jgi:stage II sporulation protein D|nr:SpoIID/LytB domain-containing protein [Endomicrobium sp.]